MRALLLVVCLSLGGLAQRPQQCTSPSLLTGMLSMSTSNGNLTVFAKYTYDALRQRIHLTEYGSFHNRTFHFSMLLLYQEHVVYTINYKNSTCTKRPLCRCFHPLRIPKNAALLGQVVLGGSSGPGQGVLVNTWAGELSTRNGTAKYMSTVTEYGCIPVSTLYHTSASGWIVTSFFNNVIGIANPQKLIPPPFCEQAQLEAPDEEDPVSFFSLF